MIYFSFLDMLLIKERINLGVTEKKNLKFDMKWRLREMKTKFQPNLKLWVLVVLKKLITQHLTRSALHCICL